MYEKLVLQYWYLYVWKIGDKIGLPVYTKNWWYNTGTSIYEKLVIQYWYLYIQKIGDTILVPVCMENKEC
jgi:hypothetical protein